MVHGGRGGVGEGTGGSSQGAVDLGNFGVESREEGFTEIGGGRRICVWGLKQLVDGGEQEEGVPVGAVGEGGEVGRFGSKESITVGGDVLFVGFSVDSEVGSFVESFKFVAGLFHSAEFRVYRVAGLVNETEAVFQGARESRESERVELSWVA